ncbi:MAG: sigma-70 family RNA polymerase sigma factor [Acidimicrobiaceae bacterium]|nr:sigma-70 family RNA polymerase sigma factor [Acidimicrobiaceae bacterium]
MVRRVGGLEILPPLSAEEEREVLADIESGRVAAHQLEFESDPQRRRELRAERDRGERAESRLIQSTLALVRHRVVERGYRFSDEDLELAGVEGLVNALQRFNPGSGARFSTYAYYWITKMVNQAIRQQAGLTESEMEHILALQRLRRSDLTKTFSARDIASALKITPERAREIRELERTFVNRMIVESDREVGDLAQSVPSVDDAPHWIIETLKRLCGDDFDAFWQWTFRTMSIEEMARGRGMSRQALSKRLERCRRAVRESPEAERLQAWFDRR